MTAATEMGSGFFAVVIPLAIRLYRAVIPDGFTTLHYRRHRTFMRCRLWLAISLVTASLFATRLNASEYSFTTADPPGSTSTFFSAINKREESVGYYTDSNRTTRGFLYEDGGFTSLDFPNAGETIAYALNDRKQVVGRYSDSTFRLHGFLYEAGVFETVDPPVANDTIAISINKKGQIVGYYWDSFDEEHGFIYDRGVFTSLDVPGASYTFATAINDRGQVIGGFADGDGKRYRTATCNSWRSRRHKHSLGIISLDDLTVLSQLQQALNELSESPPHKEQPHPIHQHYSDLRPVRQVITVMGRATMEFGSPLTLSGGKVVFPRT